VCAVCSDPALGHQAAGVTALGIDDQATVFQATDPDEQSTRPPAVDDLSTTGLVANDTTAIPLSVGKSPHHQPDGKTDTGPLAVGQQFGSRYLIIRLLGLGGMGAVYQTWDAVLGVAVALKVVRPEITRDPAAAREIDLRFKQELLLARQVTHKHVVRIHDMRSTSSCRWRGRWLRACRLPTRPASCTAT
jgi:hypothetical protein